MACYSEDVGCIGVKEIFEAFGTNCHLDNVFLCFKLTFSEELENELFELLSKNYSITSFRMIDFPSHRSQEITERNKFLQDQRRFKTVKVAAAAIKVNEAPDTLVDQFGNKRTHDNTEREGTERKGKKPKLF